MFINLYRILNALNQDKSGWVKHASSILTKYNSTVHSTIKIQPVDGTKKETMYG